MKFFYSVIANVYDLMDWLYFRNPAKSPRKAVFDKISASDKILDVCTGTATNAVTIAEKKPDAKIVGIDLSERMLCVAGRKIKKANVKNIKLYQMDATQLEFKSECFDKVLLSLVLHELDETTADRIIGEVKRVLKDNGKIIVTEWEPSKDWMKRLLFTPIHLLEPKPYRTFVKKDLYAYFAKHGLKISSYQHCDYTKVITLQKME